RVGKLLDGPCCLRLVASRLECPMMRSLSHPVHLILGLFIWACWFVVMYGGLSAVCSIEPPERGLRSPTWLNYSLMALTVVTVLLVFNLARSCWQARRTPSARSPQARFVIH